MKKNVYILTEEGREYSDEGLAYLTEKLGELSHEKNEFVFSMGAIYNDIGKFIEALKINLSKGNYPYIVISHDKIDVVYDENIDFMLQILEEAVTEGINKTTWQIAMDAFVNCDDN